MKFAAALVALSALSLATAYTCNNAARPATGTIFSDVFVNGGTCVLENAAITGSVFVRNGNLVTRGRVSISGSVTAHGRGSIELWGNARVLGVFSVSAFRGSTLIGEGATLGPVMIADTDVFDLRGTVTSLSVRTTSVVRIKGGKVNLGGLNIERNSGNVDLCGARISGGIQMLESKGSLIAERKPGCAMSHVVGTIFVLKGTGSVVLDNANITAADLTVSEQVGDVFVRQSALSDIVIASVTGNITFTQVRSDSDASISGNKGFIRMVNGDVNGDMRISGNRGGVAIVGTNFNNEVVSVTGNNGPVDFIRNKRFSASLLENLGYLSFVDNVGTLATLNNNHNTVYINGNTLTGLSCVDNTGQVTSGRPGMRTNSVSGIRSGQCVRV